MVEVIFPLIFNNKAVHDMMRKTANKFGSFDKISRSEICSRIAKLSFGLEEDARSYIDEVGGFINPTIFEIKAGHEFLYKQWCQQYATPDQWYLVNYNLDNIGNFIAPSHLILEISDEAERFAKHFAYDRLPVIQP